MVFGVDVGDVNYYIADVDSGVYILITKIAWSGATLQTVSHQNITVSGDYAFIGSGYRLTVLNIANPSTPYESGYMSPLEEAPLSSVRME